MRRRHREMNEIFPVVAGVMIALLAERLTGSARARAATVIFLCAGFGVAAAAVSGELAQSVLFALVDFAIVFLSAAAATATMEALRLVWRRAR
jgi:hypothetical protein